MLAALIVVTVVTTVLAPILRRMQSTAEPSPAAAAVGRGNGFAAEVGAERPAARRRWTCRRRRAPRSTTCAASRATPAPDVRLARMPRSRWTSFVADPASRSRGSCTRRQNPAHRLRVEHDAKTLLIHLSDEDGPGWTVFAVDRPSRRWAVAQAGRQRDAATEAYTQLYG